MGTIILILQMRKLRLREISNKLKVKVSVKGRPKCSGPGSPSALSNIPLFGILQ